MHKQRGKHIYDYLKFEDKTLRISRKMKESEFTKEFISQFEDYPVNISGMKPIRNYKRCKIVITAYMIYVTDGINMKESLKVICDVLGYSINRLPPLFGAFEKLGMNVSIIRDYDYIFKLKSEHESMIKLPELIKYIITKYMTNI